MSTSFPGALDALTNPAATDGLTGHAAQHANANDAIEALEAKVGVDNSTDPASLDYRVATLESGGGGGIWGSITGALSDQTDLQAALNGKLSASATTDAIAEGSSNLYFTAARVRDAVLTGLSTATNAVIAATDSVLTAFGKLQAQISGHTSSTANPHSVTKTQVGLGNVDNTADLNKPVSTATQAALALKANLVSPAFTTPDIGVATGTSFNSITGLSSTTPAMDGTAAVGTGTTTARGDHRHPTDTSRAPIASPSFTGPVTAPKYYNVTQPYGALQVGGADVLRFGSDNSGQLAGFRNILINGDMRINQRGVTIAAAAIGAYGPDRWKKVDASNMTQIVEDGNYKYSSVYTLSGNGVTTQQVTSPASGHWTIPSIPITATYVQLEPGSIATPFEHRPIGLELALCQRYFLAMSGLAAGGYAPASQSVISTYAFPVTMRAAPTITWTSYGTNLNATYANFYGTTAIATGLGVNAIVSGTAFIYGATATAYAEL